MCTRAGCGIFARLFHNNDKDFNPRTRAECDLQKAGCEEIFIDNFNPRTREGCDLQSRRILEK